MRPLGSIFIPKLRMKESLLHQQRMVQIKSHIRAHAHHPRSQILQLGWSVYFERLPDGFGLDLFVKLVDRERHHALGNIDDDEVVDALQVRDFPEVTPEIFLERGPPAPPDTT